MSSSPLPKASKEWQKFFDAHAANYEQNPFAQHTEAEVEFLLSLYPLSRGARILDIGCGTGRHSIALARRGYKMTGLDFSKGMLFEAGEKAKAAGVQVQWVLADATEFKFPDPYDAAICLCEGAVGLVERGEDAEAHDSSVFANIAASLKPNAPFVLTALNGYSVIRQMKDEFIAEGRFDPNTMVSNYVDEWDLPEGQTRIQINERLFIAPEVVKMLRTAGFVVDNVFGGTAGHWARRFLSLDEVEAMYVCRKRP